MLEINLISDTITRPDKPMLEAMMNASVGDDVFGEDPTVNALETKVAGMFGKEAALFCPSGTMTNQIAIKVHTQPMDEVICDEWSHIYQYEVGGYAFHSGVAISLLQGQYGKITANQIEEIIKPEADWLPRTRLVVLENSTNKGGGNFYTLDEIKPIRQLCQDRGLSLHLDGARLFNVLVETGESTQDTGKLFDSISICISKGLGAPIGSVLTGDKAFIKQARRVRKAMGGGMRQVGYLAAACIYALDHNVDRLKIDNHRASQIGQLLQSQSYIDSVNPVRTNIIIFKLANGLTSVAFLDKIKSIGVIGSAFGKYQVRFVFHKDITEEMYERLIKILSVLEFA